MLFKVFVLEVNLHGWSADGGSHGTMRRIWLSQAVAQLEGWTGHETAERQTTPVLKRADWTRPQDGYQKAWAGKNTFIVLRRRHCNESKPVADQWSIPLSHPADTLLSLPLQLRGSKLTFPDPFLSLFSYFKLALSFRFRLPFTATDPTPPAFVFSFELFTSQTALKAVVVG